MTVPDELERLVASMCEHATAAAFIAAWGEPRPSERSARRLAVAGLRTAAVEAVEVRPWDGGAVGGIEVVFARGAEPSVGELEAWLGGLDRPPVAPSGEPQLVGRWWREGLPVDATVLLDAGEANDRVRSLSILRGRSVPAPS